MTKGKQVADFYTHIDHLTHHTTSEQIYKGILNDSSTATFHGGVHVHSNAHNSNSQQLNQNILLSNKALINTKPLLEIDNDDVKCAHGATIGQLNPEELFYLESRAINPQSAKKMILQGFLNDLFNRLPANPAIQNLYKELSL